MAASPLETMAFHAKKIHGYLTTHGFDSEEEREAFARQLDRHSWFDRTFKRGRKPGELEKQFEGVALKFSQELDKNGISLVQCTSNGVDLSISVGKHAIDFSKRNAEEEVEGRKLNFVESVLLFRIKSKLAAERVVKALAEAKIAVVPAVEKIDDSAVEFSIDARHAENPVVWEIIRKHLQPK